MNERWPDFKCAMCGISLTYSQYVDGEGYCKACTEILDADFKLIEEEEEKNEI
jgi:hypothetical protein